MDAQLYALTIAASQLGRLAATSYPGFSLCGHPAYEVGLAVARKSDFHWLYLTMVFVFITMNCFVL
jgi:hypothetical protein